MTRARRVGIVVSLVLAMSLLIGAIGQYWIKNSEPYELGRAAVAAKLGVQPDAVELRRLAPFEFTDGSLSGEAAFVLCGPEEKCFTVVTKKRDARWFVVDLVQR